MKIAIVHYHLRRGGVTNVIQSAQRALQGTGAEVLVITGEEPPAGTDLANVAVVGGLSYRKLAGLSIAENLVEALKDTAADHFGAQPDVWHFHNHSLGKNVLMPLVIKGLADQKARLLLQMHDFPEDGRSRNYSGQRSFFDLESTFTESLYPQANHVHYATINGRDHTFLRKAGIKSDHVHLLPNAVSPIAIKTTPEDRPFSKDKQFVFYPTRGIRRKNMGEVLLLALAHGETMDFATSLAPDNPDWEAVHQDWVETAEKMGLPIDFGICNDETYSFPDVMGWADATLTTSVAEGFGLAFLEPWLCGKCVVGRNLPRITEDFSHSGIDLNHLYKRIDIPMSWIDETELRKVADSVLRQIYLAYDRPMPKNAVDQTFSRWVVDDCVDFGMLNEPFQKEILEKAAGDGEALASLNLDLKMTSAAEIEARKKLVEEHYGYGSYRENLTKIYRRIMRCTPSKVKHHDPKKILDQFLDPWRLNLLRT